MFLKIGLTFKHEEESHPKNISKIFSLIVLSFSEKCFYFSGDFAWPTSGYTTPYLCTGGQFPPRCCLKRRFCRGCSFLPFPTAIELMSDIINNKQFGTNDGYR